MPIAFRIPFERATHLQQLKCARGTVCYGAIAAHFQTESPSALEKLVDGRSPYDSAGDKSISNKYRRWRQGKALPGDDSVSLVEMRSNGAVKLGYWRDLALWELLAPEAPTMSRINRLLEETPTDVKRILFLDGKPDRNGRFHHGILVRDEILAIRNLHSLDAFIALLCLARKGEELEDDPQHYLPSACAFDMFPHVLHAHQPLSYRWKGLFGCLERIFWNRLYLDGRYYAFPIERIREGLAQLGTSSNPYCAEV